jgi:sugar/nucleoside kinase (ribokinase family)
MIGTAMIGTAMIGTAMIGTAMIGTVGDLVEDIAVRLDGPVNLASDTSAIIRRRRGGSAANMAVSVARHGGAARFIGQIGDDAIGTVLVEALQADGVEVVVRRGGRTGTIVVLVDAAGERTMLTDRGACADLADPDPAWLDGLSVLHVPMYSFTGGALATTAATLVGWARERSILVSVDLSICRRRRSSTRWGRRQWVPSWCGYVPMWCWPTNSRRRLSVASTPWPPWRVSPW